jgi:hypothetical protein
MAGCVKTCRHELSTLIAIKIVSLYKASACRATAKLNDLEPVAWLKDALEKLPVWPNSRIDELLPLVARTE